MKKIILISTILLFSSNIFSQGYQWKSQLEKNDSSGFYKIDLDPSIVSKLNAQFSDIRIKDEEGLEVPYFMEREPFLVTKRVFKEYRIVEKIKWINGATVLVVKNEDKDIINNIQLQIKNFDVRKRLEVSGSDDYKNWYTIKENYLFHSANGQQQTSEVKSLNFPYTDYKYYRIIIYDCYSLPINVMKIGYFDTYEEQGKFKKLTNQVVTHFDSLETKQTYIKVDFSETPYFDKMIIKAKEPTYYYRKAKICLKRKDKKGRIHYNVLDYITLNSNSDFTSYFSSFKYKEFYIVIENEDNPPLEDITIEAYQLNRYLVTHLDAGKEYKLEFKNKMVKSIPNYDINHFKNQIENNIPILSTNELSVIHYNKKKKVNPSTIWMWGVIGLVALLLAYMSYKMINEMSKNK
tara:strand:- start:1216 stop:2433 length:1218 start_codon:yes stop_codon:yes gene_type:complete